MKITYKQYRIEPAVNAVGRYDLSMEITRTKKTDKDTPNTDPETYKAETEMGYGMTLETCLFQIITNETNLGFSDSEATLSQYIENFTKEKNELMVHIKSLTQLKIN